jgi:hypothetical protein
MAALASVPTSSLYIVGVYCKQVAVGTQEDKSFTFDFAFEKETEQKTIYEDCVSPLLEGMQQYMPQCLETDCVNNCSRIHMCYIVMRLQCLHAFAHPAYTKRTSRIHDFVE